MLDDYWKKTFDGVLPEATKLRERYRDRWLRFHSLPDSKRYAESENEWEILLDRHNRLVDRLAADGAELQLITTSWSAVDKPLISSTEFLELKMDAQHWRSFAKSSDHSNWWHLFHTPLAWQIGILDAVFRLVSENVLLNVMLVDMNAAWLIHPYDGGIDLILSSVDERDTIADEFVAWRSPRHDGL